MTPGNRVEEDPISDPPGLEAEVIAEQIRLLVHKRFDLPINLLNAGIVTATLWPFYPAWVASLWLASFCIVILTRSLIRRHYRIAAPAAGASMHWARVFTLNAFATACLWGLTGSVILLTPDRVYHVFIVFVLGGMMAGGIVSNSAYKPAILAFALPTILPAIAILFTRPDIKQVEMGIMLAAFTAVLLISGRGINRSIRENFRLRIGQELLVVKLRGSETAMAEAQAVAHVGGLEFNRANNTILCTAETYRIFGVDPATFKPTFETFLARIHPDDRAAVSEGFAEFMRTGKSNEVDSRAVMDDGAIKYIHSSDRAVFDAAGHPVRFFSTVQDVTQQRQAADALAYRDRLLHAVNIGTGILVKSASLEQEMPEALRIVGETMHVDRVHLMQEPPDPRSPPVLRYSWQYPGIHTPFDLYGFVVPTEDIPALTAWREQMSGGAPLIAQLATSEGPVRAMMEHFRNQSTLLVPIFVGGTLWGTIAIDSCTVPRDWTASEIDTLKTFGDIAGALIVHHETGMALAASEERYRVMTAAARDAIITTNGAGVINHWNPAAERILGYTAAEAIGQQIYQLLSPQEHLDEPDVAFGAALSSGGLTIDLVAVRKDGIHISVELSLARAARGDDFEIIGILRDITARKDMEKKLQLANSLLTTQMEASPDGILVVDAHRRISSFNRRFGDIWRIPQADLAAGIDMAILNISATSVKDPESFYARIAYIYDHPEETTHDELEMNDGRFIDRHAVPLVLASGETFGRVWFFRDVTERRQAEAQALRMARYDGLTGLANRAVFVEALQAAVAKAKRGEQGFAVIYLDLDHFKDVNDTLGHPVGDALLQTVADRLRANTRETDTIARFGGDEFAVVAANVGAPSDAAVLADKLIDALGDPYSIQGNEIYSSASIGIDIYGPESPDAETLLSHADVALYKAKSEGRSGFRFFTDAMDAEVRMQVSLGTELHQALDSGQLFLLYQPQVCVDTGCITGVEALVRWRHPTRGILDPQLFIPVAEKIGIIVKLGHWVLLTACQQARAWLDAGHGHIRTSVNLSALQFKSPVALETEVAAVLALTGLPPHLLELELTETVLMSASREHSDIMLRLREVGVTIAIDDFGTGYSSLDYLRRFPADRIKIAQTFVQNLETTPGDVAIVKATIGLARELGIMVMAEGVETRAQLDLLKLWGCGEAQGFYFAKPLAADAVTILLRNGGAIHPASDLIEVAHEKIS